jgi:phosphatidylinositol alpha-1,6-mannosyltransferase
VLSVGRLIKRKGFDLLIRAFEEVHQAMPGAELVIVGAGPDRERLEALIRERNLGHCVKIRSGLSDADLAALYQTSRVFVLANVMLSNGDCEGCPNVVIEASASGLPVIGGIEGGASSAIIDGVTGFLIDPHNSAILTEKILVLLKDIALAKKMGEAGIQKVHEAHDSVRSGEIFGERIRLLMPRHRPAGELV